MGDPNLADFLDGADPARILGRIGEGDPLGLLVRCARALRRNALLMDPERLHQRALEVAAWAAPSRDSGRALEEWLDDRVADAVASVLGEDEAIEQSAGVLLENSAYHFVVELFGTPPDLALAAVAAFNRLPYSSRTAFFALVIDQEAPEAYAARVRIALPDLRKRVMDGVYAVSAPDWGRKGKLP